jgi:CheY-like chemotaxis protein
MVFSLFQETHNGALTLELCEMNQSELTAVSPRMLIADDDLCVVKLLAAQCTQMGFQVETATNGFGAISKANKFKPDILVVDIHIPDIDGLSVCAHLVDPTRTLAVIVITGQSSPGIAEWCNGFGARYLNKGKNFWNEFVAALSEIYAERAISIQQVQAPNFEIRKRPRVLLVDDDMSVSKLVAMRLDELGLEPLFASDVRTGLLKARREDPSVIVSDYVMPNGDAEYLLTRLRHAPETKHVPVIVHSAHALDGPIAIRLRREIAGQPGAARIVRKSLHAQELLEALKSFCAFVTKPVLPPRIPGPAIRP